MIHVEKAGPAALEELSSGYNRFVITRQGPDGPPYCVGDYLALNEWKESGYTGRCLLFRITIIKSAATCCDLLPPGVVVLGLQHMPLSGEDLRGVMNGPLHQV